jgi:ADP-dependent NAD(P)H-hydrate dehydratase / NAD(P)H-hydrate epimerase
MSIRLYTAAQVRALDRSAIDGYGIPGYTLMQRAADAAWRILRRRWPQARNIAVLCGPGNNGGDGYVLARLAREEGFDVMVMALDDRHLEDRHREDRHDDGDAALARKDWLGAGGQTLSSSAGLPPADVYVDALFGTGLTRPVDGAARALIETLNERNSAVLALDIPSGLSADTGDAHAVAVHAAVTTTFVAHKRGLFTGDAADYCGELILDTLGLPDTLYTNYPSDAQLLDVREMMRWLPARARNAHKGKYGHVLAIGGDSGMGGAIRLAGEAALRVGAGLVSVATRSEHISALNAARPELMAHAVSDAAALTPLLQRANVLALGPGLGQSAWSKTLFAAALSADKSCVIDADALNLLAGDPRPLPKQTVLTPHPGEAARLLGADTSEIGHDRFAAVREIARRYNAVVVLKGAGSLIATPQGEVAVCPWGNPGMASGGMGDVLTGVVAGLLAQGLESWQAACLGVALHAQAGDIAALSGEAGMIASDLFVPLRKLRNGLSSHD